MASNDTPPTGVPTDAIAERYEAQSDRMGSQLPQKDLNSNSRRSRRHGVPKSALACTNCRLKKIKVR